MPDTQEPAHHVRPFVYESLSAKALHFSICEIQSRMQIQDPHALDLEYTRIMMAFVLFQPEPRDIVMVGLGGGSLAKFCHRHLRRARIQVVEINPHVIALRDEFHVPRDDARFRVVQGDGARFVQGRSNCCDVLMVDGFDSDGQPSPLSSQRFYDDCCEMLRPDGILVVNLHHGHAQFEAFLDRIRLSFEHAVLAVDGSDLSNTIVFACRGRALQQARPRLLRRQLDTRAQAQLQDALARTLRALNLAAPQVPQKVW